MKKTSYYFGIVLRKIFILLFCFVIVACTTTAKTTFSSMKSGSIIVSSFIESRFPGKVDSTLLIISEEGITSIPDKLEYLNDFFEWSPDGQWVITLDFKDNPGLNIINTSTELVTRMFSGQIYDASWAPDSHHIIYTTFGKPLLKFQIYMLDMSCFETKNCQEKDIFIAEGFSPVMSPDGKRIAFTENDHIFVVDVNNLKQPTKISQDLQNCDNPDWSPDNLRITFDCKFDIYIVNADGTGIENITGGISDDPSTPWWPRDFMPKWNPKGNILFISERNGLGKPFSDNDTVSTNALFMIDPKSKNITRLTDNQNMSIVWYALATGTKSK